MQVKHHIKRIQQTEFLQGNVVAQGLDLFRQRDERAVPVGAGAQELDEVRQQIADVASALHHRGEADGIEHIVDEVRPYLVLQGLELGLFLLLPLCGQVLDEVVHALQHRIEGL